MRPCQVLFLVKLSTPTHRVSIILYDISGREVKTLVNDQRTSGYYTIQFNSAGLSSGVYFYRIMTKSSGSDFIIAKKMALIR